MRTVFEGVLLRLSVSDDGAYAWITRSERSSRDGGEGELDRLEREVAALPASRMAAIVDVRRAPGRNDEGFEASILPRFRAITARFGRLGFLVGTAIGKMQVLRIERELGMSSVVFTDEVLARRFAEEGR